MSPFVEAQLYRDAGAVTRYHAKRTHRTQTIADHTFGVLMLIKQVTIGYGTFGMQARCMLYDAVLHHDLPELITGDIPAPIKRSHPQLGPLMDEIERDLAPLYREYDLTHEEAALVKWADRMELVLWCYEEYRMGNMFALDTIRRGMGWIITGYVPACAVEFTNDVVAELATKGIAPATGAELEMTR